MENMRNKNYSQAERMMQQAILRASKNYQPHVLLGFIALETDNARKAESHWQNALSLCYTSLQQTYLILLKARLKEIQGIYDQAHGLYLEAHGHSSKWLEPRYRQAVSITKKGFLDQAWMVFSELIAEDPNYFNRILIDPELERGRSFFLSSLARPWSQSRRQAATEKEEMGKLSQKLETWFETEDPFRQDVMESLQNLQDKSSIENYVAFSRTAQVMARLHKETEQKIKEAIATTKLTIRKDIERLRLLHAEIGYFPFPRLIRRTKENFNKAGKMLHGLSKMDLQVGSVYKKTKEQLIEAEKILDKLEARLKSIKILRDATLFVLLVGKSFLWLSILALVASMVAVPVMLHSMQSSGSEWATEWLTTQRWQVQRTVSLIMVFISGVVAAVWTSLRFEKQKNKYLTKKMKNKRWGRPFSPLAKRRGGLDGSTVFEEMARRAFAQKKAESIWTPLFATSKKNVLDAAGGLGQTGHFAGAFAGSGREQLIDVLEFVTGNLGQNADHGSDTVFLVVILQEIDDFLVLIGQFLDTFALFDVIHPLGTPVLKALQESVFINVEGFSLKFNCGHCQTSLNSC
jgi:tetratricopeptide (TPR) repeat protein